jgi:starch synthase (maltosyl-transferring)
LAATLSGTYGIYSGFELTEAAFIPGKEEYLNSEKYELRAWDWNRPGHIRAHITRLNHIRRGNPALQGTQGLRFYNAFNDNILLYGRMSERVDNFLLIAVNLDPHNTQSCDFEVPLWEFGLPDHASLIAEDLLNDSQGRFHGKMQRLDLDPRVNPCAIWRLRRTEEKA